MSKDGGHEPDRSFLARYLLKYCNFSSYLLYVGLEERAPFLFCLYSKLKASSNTWQRHHQIWVILSKTQCNDHIFGNYVLEKTEIALPGELQESLLSQSCGAKDVVVQLKETMQLDQASLERPDLKTRKLIRCFARKAKDSKRLDVVQHLREITPAGTTGKSAKLLCFVSVYLHVHYCWHSILEQPILALPATLCREFSAEIT